MLKTTFATTGALLVASHASAGSTVEIDLDAYAHGTVLNGVDLGPLTAGVDNFHSSTDLLVAFDTTLTGTRDRDLEGPNSTGGSWDSGNLAGSGADVGTILIIQEINRSFAGYTDASETVVSSPDDEGRRSGGTDPGAGEITFNFDQNVNAFASPSSTSKRPVSSTKRPAFFALFSGGGETVKVSFADLIDPDSIFYDPSVQFGDNSANRIEALTAAELGLTAIESVTINLGGSGGSANCASPAYPAPPQHSAAWPSWPCCWADDERDNATPPTALTGTQSHRAVCRTSAPTI